MITYLDPAGEVASAPVTYDLRLDVGAGPITLGLIANAFPDASTFMDCLEESVLRELPGTNIRRFQKVSVDPIDPELFAEMVACCDAAIAAWGH